MIIETGREGLSRFLRHQLTHLFLLEENERAILNQFERTALERLEFCFRSIGAKYYQRNGQPYFNPLQGSQYCIFLYYLSNSLSKSGAPSEKILADKVYGLNKAMHAVDLYHEVDLPSIFILDHPLGTVMGRGQFSNHFAFAQNCTVGNIKGKFPVIDEWVGMKAGAKLLGGSKIGHHVIISADCVVKDTEIPPCSYVFGASPNLIIKPTTEAKVEEHLQFIKTPALRS